MAMMRPPSGAYCCKKVSVVVTRLATDPKSAGGIAPLSGTMTQDAWSTPNPPEAPDPNAPGPLGSLRSQTARLAAGRVLAAGVSAAWFIVAARQLFVQKLREVESESVFSEFAHKKGDIVTCIVSRFEGPHLVCKIGEKAEATMLDLAQTSNAFQKVRCANQRQREADRGPR